MSPYWTRWSNSLVEVPQRVVRPRFDKLSADRQNAIIEAAADEFADRGFDSASVNRIISSAGMSKGSLYYYFEDKDDLFATVMERATVLMVRLVGGVEPASLTADTFWPVCEGFVRRSVERLEQSTWYVRLARAFYRHWGRTGDRGAAGKVFEWVRRLMADLLHRGQELGVVRSDLPLEFLVELTMGLGQSCDRWMLETWETHAPEERERLIEVQLDLYRRLLQPSGVTS